MRACECVCEYGTASMCEVINYKATDVDLCMCVCVCTYVYLSLAVCVLSYRVLLGVGL